MQDAQQQLMAAQSEGAQVAKAKAMMEVETLRISQRIEILNNISTQATLLAGSALAFLGGESLETVDEYTTTSTRIGHLLFVGSGALALVCSLWVIVISSHLIAMTRDASLRKNIVKASKLLDLALRQVRGMHVTAIAFVLVSSLIGACLNTTLGPSLMCIFIFGLFGIQMVLKTWHLNMMFLKGCELEFDVAGMGSFGENIAAFFEPLKPSVARVIWTANAHWEAHQSVDMLIQELESYKELLGDLDGGVSQSTGGYSHREQQRIQPRTTNGSPAGYHKGISASPTNGSRKVRLPDA